MRHVAIVLAALVAGTAGVASAQLVAEVRSPADVADARALSSLVERGSGDLTACLGRSATVRSETVLWLVTDARGAVGVSLALHRGPAEGVGPCIVDVVRRWRLPAGARRRIELVLRTGAPPAATDETPSGAGVAPPAVPMPAPPAPPAGSAAPARERAGAGAPPSTTPTGGRAGEVPGRAAQPARVPPAPPAPPPRTAPPPPPAPPPRTVPSPPPALPPGAPLPEVRVGYGRPVVSGPLPRGEVQRVALLRRARLVHCYAEAVAVEPGLAGSLVMTFRVEPSGAVQSVSHESSTVERPALEHCFVRALRAWRFEARTGAGPTRVRLPLLLQPAP